MRLSSANPIAHRRAGQLLPALVIGILVAGGCLALVLNQYALQVAQEELRTAAGGAALAAVQDLVSDDLLKTDHDPQALTRRARLVAEVLAESYTHPGDFPPAVEVRCGREVVNPNTGASNFLETDYAPTSVKVIASRDRQHGNGVTLFAPYITGNSTGDAVATAEASFSNLILGVRPVRDAGVPAWPLAILQRSDDPRIPTWTSQIDERQGTDEYGWDQRSGKLTTGPDGIPEIVLTPTSATANGNVLLVNLGRGLGDAVLSQQFRDGWKSDDLQRINGELLLDRGPIEMGSTQDLSGAVEDWIRSQLGSARILLLYTPTDETGVVHATQLVCGRALKVDVVDGQLQVILQPAVIATRTAVLDEEALSRGESRGNPYIYKASLTQ